MDASVWVHTKEDAYAAAETGRGWHSLRDIDAPTRGNDASTGRREAACGQRSSLRCPSVLSLAVNAWHGHSDTHHKISMEHFKPSQIVSLRPTEGNGSPSSSALPANRCQSQTLPVDKRLFRLADADSIAQSVSAAALLVGHLLSTHSAQESGSYALWISQREYSFEFRSDQAATLRSLLDIFQEQFRTCRRVSFNSIDDDFPASFVILHLILDNEEEVIMPLRREGEGQLVIALRAATCEVSVKLFSSSNGTGQRDLDVLASHFSTLIASFFNEMDCSGGSAPLLATSMISLQEHAKLTRFWPQGNGERPLPEMYTQQKPRIYDYFVEQVNRIPQKIALQDHNDIFVTYSQLDEWSTKLAVSLQRRGVGVNGVSDLLVPIILDRSATTIAALLGTLAAGGAYLPMEPDLADGRKKALLEACRKQNTQRGSKVIIVTSGAMLNSIESILTETEVQDAIKIEDILAADPFSPPISRLQLEKPDSDWLAYVLFTSGSTGDPKVRNLCFTASKG